MREATVGNRIQQLTPRRLFVLVFVLGALLRLVYVGRETMAGNIAFAGSEMPHIAAALVERGEFADPYGYRTGPTSHSPPLFAASMSLLLRLIPDRHDLVVVLRVIAALTSALCWAILVPFAVRLGLPKGLGAAAGALGALQPMRLWVETNGVWETPYVALGLVLLAMAFWKTLKSDEVGVTAWIAQGLGWGMVLLLNVSCLTVLFGLALVSIFLLGKLRDRSWHRGLAILFFTTGVVLMPWIVRNYMVFHKFIFVRGNIGLEMELSFHDGVAVYADSESLSHMPTGSKAEAAQMMAMGELAYFAMKKRVAEAWIQAHPAEFVSLTAKRVFAFWFLAGNSLAKSSVQVPLMLLGMLGLRNLYRAYRDQAILLATFCVFFPIPYYLHNVDDRYGYPIYWVMVFCCASAGLRWFMPAPPAGEP